MKTNNKLVLNIPCFQGFYDSILYDSQYEYETINDIAADEHRDYDDYIFDKETYMNDICKAYTKEYADYLSSIISDAEFSHFTSPREYNFETDMLYANITFKNGWKEYLLGWIENNKATLTERIKHDWTSYDGFVSFVPTDLEIWKQKLIEEDVLYVTYLVYYYGCTVCRGIYSPNSLGDYIAQDVLEKVSMYSYVNLKDENNIEK